MTTALEAVEVLRERRADRARRSSGLREGWNEQFRSPAEEAAERLARIEADRALVESELAQAEERNERAAAEAKAGPARLRKATEAYLAARHAVDFHTLLTALQKCVEARKEYEAAFWQCDKYGVLPADHVRELPIQAGEILSEITKLAVNA